VQVLGDTSTTVRYSNVEGGAPGVGNIDADPLWLALPSDGGDGWGDDPLTPGTDESANDDFGNLRLALGSPCIDAGDTTTLAAPGTALDFARLQRAPNDPATLDTGLPVSFYAVDMGAYEQQGPWVDLGGGTSGSAGAPALVGSGFLEPGRVTPGHLSNARPSAPVRLLVAVQSTPIPFARISAQTTKRTRRRCPLPPRNTKTCPRRWNSTSRPP
jgi:hypothetical protein